MAAFDPAALPDLYATTLRGRCLEPLIMHGQHVVIDKREPCRAGDLVACYLRPEAVRPGSCSAFIKILDMAPPSWVTFPWRENPKSEAHALMGMRMLNPAGTFWVKCADVLAMNRVVGVEARADSETSISMDNVVPIEEVLRAYAEKMARQPAAPPAPRVVLPVPEPIDRALRAHKRLPKSCIRHRVEENRFAPLLPAGATAVLDVTDRVPVEGEIFLVKIASHRGHDGFVRKLVQLRSAKNWGMPDCWMLHFSLIRRYARALTSDERVALLQSGQATLCDGPMSDEGMRERIVGRVVGIIGGDAR